MNWWPPRQLLRRLRRAMRSGRSETSGAPPSSFVRVAYCVPRQVVLLTARHDGADNVWPVDWHTPLSQEPELYGVAAGRDGYGTSLIRDSGAFVVNFVPADWEETIFFCGRTSGRTMDKLAARGLRTEPAQAVDAPVLADALGSLECRVEQVIETGDHILLVGRVVHRVHRREAPRLHHVDVSLADTSDQFERS